MRGFPPKERDPNQVWADFPDRVFRRRCIERDPKTDEALDASQPEVAMRAR